MELINIKILTTRDIIFLASLLGCILHTGVFFAEILFKTGKTQGRRHHVQNSNRISIILSVRNEEQHIREILDKFKEQQFEDYQLLVINVHSEDNTDGILNVLAEANPKLKVTSLSQETQFSEKQIINIGLKGASSPLDRFTDVIHRRN